jgi:hypothetical protein
MARTKVVARRSTGTAPPRQQLAVMRAKRLLPIQMDAEDSVEVREREQEEARLDAEVREEGVEVEDEEVETIAVEQADALSARQNCTNVLACSMVHTNMSPARLPEEHRSFSQAARPFHEVLNEGELPTSRKSGGSWDDPIDLTEEFGGNDGPGKKIGIIFKGKGSPSDPFDLTYDF